MSKNFDFSLQSPNNEMFSNFMSLCLQPVPHNTPETRYFKNKMNNQIFDFPTGENLIYKKKIEEEPEINESPLLKQKNLKREKIIFDRNVLVENINVLFNK